MYHPQLARRDEILPMSNVSKLKHYASMSKNIEHVSARMPRERLVFGSEVEEEIEEDAVVEVEVEVEAQMIHQSSLLARAKHQQTRKRKRRRIAEVSN
jgi:hypothetical protein